MTKEEAIAAVRKHGGNKTAAAASIGMTRHSLNRRLVGIGADHGPRCKKHPKYKALYPPRVLCLACAEMYATANPGMVGASGSEVLVSASSNDDGTLEVTAAPLVDRVSVSSLDADGLRHIGLRSEGELRAYAGVPASYSTVVFRGNNWVQQDGIGKFVAHQAKGTFAPPPVSVAAVESLLERLAEAGPIPAAALSPGVLNDPKMLELDIFDLHLGMTTADYDIDEAVRLFKDALNDLVARAGPDIELIVFPVGNDLFHVDGPTHTTTKGTAQPEASDYYSAFDQGLDLMLWAVSTLREVAPVRVVVLPGNHDEVTVFHLGHVLRAYFRNDDQVTVDASSDTRKYVRYGVNLIGFEHGQNIPASRLAAIMAQERPDDWAATWCREWHLGHQHRKGQLSEQGVSIEYLPSLVSSNRWHKANGYDGQVRSAVAFVWSRDRGPLARLQYNATQRVKVAA